MDYTRFAISNPVKIAVAVLLLLLFGLIALFTIPIQLVPNVDRPMITVQTNWTGRSPEEVEKEVIEPQEDKLDSISNLRKLTATASQGRAEVRLEFFIGTDMTRALQEVSDKLREVPSYPDGVDQPVVTVADAASENAIAWMVLTSGDPDFNVASLYDDADRRIKPYLERVEGLSQVNIYGGREREVHIQIDPRRMAERGVTFNQLRHALRMENVNVSAGEVTEGRLDVRVRTVAQYDELEPVRQTVVAHGPGGPIRVRDLGDVVLTLEKRRTFVHANGQTALAINAIRESGSNVVAVMNGLRRRVAEVNRDVLPGMGPQLQLRQVYDETRYIYNALDLVRDNLWQGGLLTILVLLAFMRSLRPTLIIAMAIPISIIGTFVVMTAFGRNLNVVSIAGLAFAIGMVVDNAIVVLENIDRHIGLGKSPVRAAYDGAREVWAAILAATLTTLVVFLPVLTIEEEAGQLFYDISLAICAAVALAFLVATTVIPAAGSRWLKPRPAKTHGVRHQLRRIFGLAPLLAKLGSLFSRGIYLVTGSWTARVGIVALLTLAALVGAWLLMPPTTYLPNGNRNLVFGFLLTPPAYSIEQNERMAARMEARLRPYWEARSRADLAGQPPVIDMRLRQPVPDVPPLETFFFVSFNGQVFYGAASAEEQNVQPVTALLPWAGSENPGVIPFAFQAGLFGRGFGGGNSVEVEVAGMELGAVRAAAMSLYGRLVGVYSPFNVQTDPRNFELPGPELQVNIDRVTAAELDIDASALGLGVQALVDGMMVGDYRYQGRAINLMVVRDPALELTRETLAQVPVAISPAHGGGAVPLASVATIRDSTSPQQIKRIEKQRAVTLTVTAPPGMALEQVTRQIDELVGQMRSSGDIPPSVDIAYAGTADKLVQVRESFLGGWHGWSLQSLYSLITSRMFLALLVCYLVMAAVFESFLYPFVIMFSVPLATVGGFMGLAVVHWFDPTQLLDVVTMLGFVILIGVVVNNAILVVTQALNFMRGLGESGDDKLERALPPREAIAESVRTRLRPIMMTTLTTVFGMLPLVMKPGAGSELYRGLGSVVLGGLIVSSMFTLIVVPLVFSLVLDLKIAVYRRLGWPVPELNEGETIEPATPRTSGATAGTAVS